jgi:hypothetical protein
MFYSLSFTMVAAVLLAKLVRVGFKTDLIELFFATTTRK